VRAGHAAYVARELDDGALHAQANAQVRDLVLATVLDGLDLALDAALSEAAGHDHAVGTVELLGDRVGREVLAVDPAQVEPAAVVDGGVLERLPDREVRLVELHVLADQSDRHLALTGVDTVNELAPLIEVGWVTLEAQHAHDEVVETLVVQEQGHAVDVVGVARRHDGIRVDVAEQGDLLADALFERLLGAGDDDVGLDADLAQLGDGMLRRLGLRLADHADHRHEGDVHVEDVLAADVFAELTDGLEEG